MPAGSFCGGRRRWTSLSYRRQRARCLPTNGAPHTFSLDRRHRAVEFRAFLDTIEAAVPADLEVHVILDNYGTRKTALIKRWLAKHPRYHLHFTPTGASWLNLVERFFALLTEKQVRRGAHRSAAELERAILAYLAIHNENPKPFIWTKSADQILVSVARFCQRTLDSAH